MDYTEMMQDLINNQSSNSIPQEKPIKQYQLVKVIGRGGMGRVYQAFDTNKQQTVALKVLLKKKTELRTKRFAREARAMSKLNHPNILPVYEFGTTKETAFISMPLVGGPSLRKLMDQQQLPFEDIATIMSKVANAIDYAHKNSVIHRDLKPDNILLENNEPKVVDFGLAKLTDDIEKLSRTGQLIGTIQYMSPEQISGEKQLSEQSDIYSLGAILYELLTGELPVPGENLANLMLNMMKHDIIPPTQLNKKVPKALEQICLKALSKNIEDRHQSAQHLAYELRNYLNKKSTSFTIKFSRRYTLIATTILILAFATYFFSNSSLNSQNTNSSIVPIKKVVTTEETLKKSPVTEKVTATRKNINKVIATEKKPTKFTAVRKDIPKKSQTPNQNAPMHKKLKAFHPQEIYALLKKNNLKHTKIKNFGGNNYLYIQSLNTREQASQICRSLGGYLVTITNEEESNFVASLQPKAAFWIGLERNRYIKSIFSWVTNEALSYTSWHFSGPPQKEHQIFAWMKNDDKLMWYGTPDEKAKLPFVCEWGPNRKFQPQDTTRKTIASMFVRNNQLHANNVVFFRQPLIHQEYQAIILYNAQQPIQVGVLLQPTAPQYRVFLQLGYIAASTGGTSDTSIYLTVNNTTAADNKPLRALNPDVEFFEITDFVQAHKNYISIQLSPQSTNPLFINHIHIYYTQK